MPRDYFNHWNVFWRNFFGTNFLAQPFLGQLFWRNFFDAFLAQLFGATFLAPLSLAPI
jgi:hypothetical protein